MGVWAQPLANGVYTIKNVINNRGTLVAVEDQVNVGAADITLSGYEGKSETAVTNGEKWYVCTKGNSVYFYNVANGKFLNGRTADQVQFSEQPQADGFALVAHDEYFAIVTGNYKLSCCPGYEKGQTVRWLTDDEANSQHLTFTPVENGGTDYADQIAAAEEELAKIVRFSYSFVYNGVEKYSQDCASFVDADYPAITKNFPFGVVASKPSGKVSADVAGTKVEVNLTINLPFEYVESIEDYGTLSKMEEATGKWKWYYLTFHANNKRKLYYDGTANVLDASKSAVDEANEDAYSWAFVGNPFDGFMVVNKLAGAEKGIKTTDAGAVVDGGAQVLALTTSTYGVKGFFMQAATGNYTQRFNFSENKVKYWDGADAGSTFMVELRKTEKQRYIELVAEVNQLLEDNKWNHTEEPALGEYTTAGYEALSEALSEIPENADATIESLKAAIESLEAAVLAFDLTKNRPIFTIDGVADYASGMSIYDDPGHVNAKGNSHYFKTTDVTDEYMLWTFDLTETVVGVTDAVEVRNLGSGNLFWDAPAIVVTETSPAIEDDGVFLFYANGGDPVHAQDDNKVITKWNAKDAASGSAWKFTFVGVSNPAAYDLSEVKETFAAQVEAFAALGENEAFTVLEEMKNNWSFVNNRMQEMAGTIEAGGLVLKSDVESAMRQMNSYFAVPEAYAAYKVAKADADSVLVGLKDMELAEEDATAYATLQSTVAMMDETFPYASSAMDISMYKGMLENAAAPFYDIDTPLGDSEGDVEWIEIPAGGNEIYQADLSGLQYWTAVGNTNFSVEKGAMEFVAGENTAASLIQADCPFGEGTYRLTGKAFHKGAVNAVMFVGDQTVAVVEAEDDDASYENADRDFYGADKYSTPSIEFTIASPIEGYQNYSENVNVGYRCEFDNPEDLFVVGALTLEKKQVNSVTLKDKFEQVLGLDSENGFVSLQYYVEEFFTSFEPAYTELLNKSVMPILTALKSGKKVLKHKMANAIEEMEAMLAEVTPLIEYVQRAEYIALTESAATIRDDFYEESNAYALLDEALLAAMGVVLEEKEVDGEVVVTPKYYAKFKSVDDIEAALEALAAALEAAEAKIPDAITLDKEEAELSDNQRTIQLTATVTAESETADKSVFWVSDEEDVAMVDENGLVTAVAEGTAYITAYSIHKNLYAECEVTVTALTDGIDGFEVKVETVIYDIHGRQVEKMEKGFYIVNGKKVFVK